MSDQPSRAGLPLAGLLLALTAAMLASGWWAVLALLATVILAAWLTPAALGSVLRWRWILLMALLVVPGALWVGEPDTPLAGVTISQSGLALGLQMACRASAVFIAVSAVSRAISVTALSAMLERVGMRGLGFAIGVGFHALPTLRRRFSTAYAALRLRGGFRRRRWRAVQLLLITVVMGALRYGEEVVLAAEARAFQTGDELHGPPA